MLSHMTLISTYLVKDRNTKNRSRKTKGMDEWMDRQMDNWMARETERLSL